MSFQAPISLISCKGQGVHVSATSCRTEDRRYRCGGRARSSLSAPHHPTPWHVQLREKRTFFDIF
eukprot:4698240-Prymnesium_polylepis.2